MTMNLRVKLIRRWKRMSSWFEMKFKGPTTFLFYLFIYLLF